MWEQTVRVFELATAWVCLCSETDQLTEPVGSASHSVLVPTSVWPSGWPVPVAQPQALVKASRLEKVRSTKGST